MSKLDKKKVLFFAKVPNKKILSDVSFYEQDIRALKDMGYDVQVSNQLRDILSCHYDVLYVWWWTYSLLPIVVSRLRGAKCIVAGAFHYETPLMSGTDFVRRSWLYRVLIGLSLRTAHMNIFVSACEYNAVVNNLPVNNPRLVYHGIDTDVYVPCDGRDDALLDKPNRTPQLLCISWMEKNNIERKCIREVVDALEILYLQGVEANLILVGRPGPGYEEFKEFVATKACAKNITFKGHVTEAEKIDLLRASTMYVSPTLYEGFGIAIAESLSVGCPVITSKNGAVPEVVGGCAIFVDPLSPESIAQAILTLVQNPDTRLRLSKLGRRRVVSKYSYRKHSESLANAVLSLSNIS
jgi:glycosyltransferase involved in cell wall biosynthesis